MKFDFYYSEESEQYSFYSVPKMFFTLERFTGLSAMSKLLYGFLLDRMSLSRKRNWIDDKNRAYIKYSLNAITKDMGVSKNSVIKYMRELQEFGLIMKFQIEGMEDIIYVMDFSRVKQADNSYSNNKSSNNGDVLYLDNQTAEDEYKTDTGQACNAPPDFNATIALSNINDTKKIQDTECKGECTLGGGSKSEPVQNLNRFKTCTGSKLALVQNLNRFKICTTLIKRIIIIYIIILIISLTRQIDIYIIINLSINLIHLSIHMRGWIRQIRYIQTKMQLSSRVQISSMNT